MLLETQTRPVSSGGIMETAQATIKATPKIFSFFADQTYSNKPLAICRELAANAIDAHTAAGIADEPIEVWVPTELDPTFRVRDHGIGMSHAFMMTGFLAYTDGSTKDGSNDQIGGFGIGSKSPFAYVDQFTIRSAYEGTLSVYTMFIDETGIPSIGLLGQRATNEGNGVEVSFPVKSDDFGTFANAANEALKYFHPLPIVHNGHVDDPDYMSRGNGWAMRRQGGPLAVIMGGVRYPVATHNLPYSMRYDSEVSTLLDYGLDLTVPIGTCGVALSRESLSYNEKTYEGLQAALEACKAEIISSFSEMFDDCPTEWEAKKALMAEVPDGTSHGARGKLLLEAAKYRGKPLLPTLSVSGSFWQIDTPSHRRRSKSSCPNAEWDFFHSNYDHFRFDRYELIIVDDLPQSPKSRTIQRIKTYVDLNCVRNKPSIVLRDCTFDVDIPDAEFLFTSSLPEPEKVARVKGDRPKVRMFGLMGDRGSSINPGRYGSNGITEVAYADQPDTGILVTCDNFTIPLETHKKLKLGLVGWSECHFVNKADAEKLKGWTAFDDAFDERIRQLVEDNPELPNQLAISNASYAWSELIDWLRLVNLTDLKASKQKTPLGQILSLRDKYVTPLNRDFIKFAPYVSLNETLTKSAETLLTKFNKQQWKAARIVQLTQRIKQDSEDYKIFMELL